MSVCTEQLLPVKIQEPKKENECTEMLVSVKSEEANVSVWLLVPIKSYDANMSVCTEQLLPVKI